MAGNKSSGIHPKELARMRGEIITGFANLESGISKYIAAFFVDPKLENSESLLFLFGFLYHKYLNFETKKDIFVKICKFRKIEKIPLIKISRLQQIRNAFAHAWNVVRGDNEQDLVLFGDESKKGAEALYQEFKKLYGEVTGVLDAVFEKEKWWGKR